MFFGASANYLYLYENAGGLANGVTDSYFHAIQGIVTGANTGTIVCGGSQGASCSTSGTATSVNPGSLGIGTGNIYIGSNNTPGGFLTGYVSEFGWWTVAFNSTQYGNMNSNQYNFWGPF
jgi:hypothetical protein